MTERIELDAPSNDLSDLLLKAFQFSGTRGRRKYTSYASNFFETNVSPIESCAWTHNRGFSTNRAVIGFSQNNYFVLSYKKYYPHPNKCTSPRSYYYTYVLRVRVGVQTPMSVLWTTERGRSASYQIIYSFFSLHCPFVVFSAFQSFLSSTHTRDLVSE